MIGLIGSTSAVLLEPIGPRDEPRTPRGRLRSLVQSAAPYVEASFVAAVLLATLATAALLMLGIVAGLLKPLACYS